MKAVQAGSGERNQCGNTNDVFINGKEGMQKCFAHFGPTSQFSHGFFDDGCPLDKQNEYF